MRSFRQLHARLRVAHPFAHQSAGTRRNRDQFTEATLAVSRYDGYDRVRHNARIALSRWRHGFESRWGCDKTQVSGPPRRATLGIRPSLLLACSWWKGRMPCADTRRSEATLGSCGCTSVGCSTPAAPPGCPPTASVIAIDHDTRAGGGERLRHGSADSRRGSGHECGLARQVRRCAHGACDCGRPLPDRAAGPCAPRPVIRTSSRCGPGRLRQGSRESPRYLAAPPARRSPIPGSRTIHR
jgi:hypothetical protein